MSCKLSGLLDVFTIIQRSERCAPIVTYLMGRKSIPKEERSLNDYIGSFLYSQKQDTLLQQGVALGMDYWFYLFFVPLVKSSKDGPSAHGHTRVCSEEYTKGSGVLVDRIADGRLLLDTFGRHVQPYESLGTEMMSSVVSMFKTLSPHVKKLISDEQEKNAFEIQEKNFMNIAESRFGVKISGSREGKLTGFPWSHSKWETEYAKLVTEKVEKEKKVKYEKKKRGKRKGKPQKEAESSSPSSFEETEAAKRSRKGESKKESICDLTQSDDSFIEEVEESSDTSYSFSESSDDPLINTMALNSDEINGETNLYFLLCFLLHFLTCCQIY